MVAAIARFLSRCNRAWERECEEDEIFEPADGFGLLRDVGELTDASGFIDPQGPEVLLGLAGEPHKLASGLIEMNKANSALIDSSNVERWAQLGLR
jgi:hypothetical protein